MKTFKTYNHTQNEVRPEHNAYMMYVQVSGGPWKFKGLVSESAKKVVQSDDTVEELSKKYREQEILSTFTQKPVEETNKVYLFIPCPSADVSTFNPVFEEDETDSSES